MAHNMFLPMPVSGDAHEDPVGKFKQHHYSLVGDFLQLQSGGLCFQSSSSLPYHEDASWSW